ncbi:AMP-dependent synthetase and ligase [Isosphaera pallida ATCC 43644]|uniref:AMP-dependent synthetase and ligase n=1 Tax=Isosphaera pallida (strain ATCC 43644 / DSM 9630 / IS1B) TaxID=575540 RepID=E8R446_ISOPI|nr:AMP-binding protein [Isosphaera pallida]ADV61633.1 AMP-dependent synthetase and ligase [Isosphaera pallida ATCC 43644]
MNVILASNRPTVSTGSISTDPLVALPDFPASWNSLGGALWSVSKRAATRVAMWDSTGASLTYSELLVRACVLWRALSRRLTAAENVGILMPPLVPSAVANLALNLGGRVPVNLNYTAGAEAVNSAIRQAGITHVVTARKATDRLGFVPDAEPIWLEDLPATITTIDKAWGFFVSKLGAGLASWFLPGLRGNRLDRLATIIFTSGSTGDPKGVMLSHRNILSNVMAVGCHLDFHDDDKLLGVLPFFHSMGTTICLWMALVLGIPVVFHSDPRDARVIGDLIERHELTILLGTPTFMRMYLTRCKPPQLKSLRYLILGAEKLKPELERDIREKLGITPLEGYGCTELSPVVSVNTPFEVTAPDGRTIPGNRVGTVGRPIPGTAVRTIHPETGEPLPPGTEGLVLVKGPQVMMGYLNKPEETAAVLKEGWYNTGDLGLLDADGFLKINDRLSRFSKIAGEMVPHVKVESAIMAVTGRNEQQVAVTGVLDHKRGEKLVVLYVPASDDAEHPVPPLEPEVVVKAIREAGLPNLWVPDPADFFEIDHLPTLGSGKIDLKALKQIARSKAGI